MDRSDMPRETVIHQSANRPHLILGGDRELVLVAGLTSACLAFTLMSITGVALALVVWWGCVAVFSRMGKADPLLRHVYLRHVRYRGFYPAKSGLYSKPDSTGKSWR